MKTSQIIGLLIVSAALAVVISTFRGASQYMDFAAARKLSQSAKQPTAVHVVGRLIQGPDGHIKGIVEGENRSTFRFPLADAMGRIEEVHYAHPVPTDFRRAEQIVVVGYAKKTHFLAKKILLKCPSKYQNKQSIDG